MVHETKRRTTIQDLDVALAGYSKPIGVTTTVGQLWERGGGHRLQGYLPAVVQHGQETAAAAAAVQAIYPGALGNPLYSVYPFPIYDQYEYTTHDTISWREKEPELLISQLYFICEATVMFISSYDC